MNESELESALNELKQTDVAKFNFVYGYSSDFEVEAALKSAKRSKGWFYGMPQEEQERLRLLAVELNAQAKYRARRILDDATVDAAIVKVGGLTSRDERVKQSVSTEILDRTVGKPDENMNVKNSTKVVVRIVHERAGI